MSSKLAKSPVARARQRRAPALSLPPQPPKRSKQDLLGDLVLVTAMAALTIGPAIVDQAPRVRDLDETTTITLSVLDDGTRVLKDGKPAPAGAVRDLLTDQVRTVNGARIEIDGYQYVVADYEIGLICELHLEDMASWQMRLFTSFRAFPRDRYNRAQAFHELVREAGSSPLVPLRAWIPELNDRQRVAKTPVEHDGGPSTTQGPGRNPTYKVKGKIATARQRRVIDESLTEAKKDGATKRVLIAVVMMKTQESRMGEDVERTGDDDLGDSQQGRPWISLQNASKADKTTRAFLLGDEANVGGTGGVKGWKQHFGSLKVVPGGYEAAIKKVQGSVGGYDQWEDEATRTVEKWLGAGGDDVEEFEAKTYEFLRGTRDGQRQTSWACSADWAQEVGAHRWAVLNTPCWASGPELIAAAPVLHIDGDEPWINGDTLTGTGIATRAVDEVTFTCLAERWALLQGAVVTLDERLGVLQGRYLVQRIEDDLANGSGGEAQVTLTRPRKLLPEPAATEAAADSGTSSKVDKYFDVCQQISDQGRPYVWGGGHGPRLATLMSTRVGLDCSGSTCLALHEAGMFDSDTAIVSGDFANWGVPGKGKHMTVWYSPVHVWSEFHGGNVDGYRFDTSPHGDGPSGPRVRHKARGHDTFQPRHWPGT